MPLPVDPNAGRQLGGQPLRQASHQLGMGSGAPASEQPGNMHDSAGERMRLRLGQAIRRLPRMPFRPLGR